MTLPRYIVDTIGRATREKLWAAAFVATLLMPLTFIFVRAGIEACSGLIGVAFLIHCARTRQWAWLREPWARVCLAAYAWLMLVVTPLALDPALGLWDAALWWRMPLLFAALRYWVLAEAKARTTLATALAVVLALIMLDTLVQFVTGMSLSGNARVIAGPFIGRLTGPFSKLVVGYYLGKFIVPVVAIALAATLAAQHRRATVGLFALLALAIVTIVASGERSAFVTTMLALGTTMGVLMLTEKRWRMPCLVAGVALIAVLGVTYAASPFVQDRAGQMRETMQHYGTSDYGTLARAGYDIGRAHLLHGAGLRSFRVLCPDLHYTLGTFRGMHPHNHYMEWFAEAGLPGLLLFIALIAALAREALAQVRAQHGAARLMPAIALGALMQHFFPLMGMQSFFTNWSALLLWFVLALMFAGIARAERPVVHA